MIRLILDADTLPKIHLFNNTPVFIGTDPSCSDLVFDSDQAPANLIEIRFENENWIAINLSNDPFISVNDIPFRKKQLLHGDILSFNERPVLFECLESPSDLSEIPAIFNDAPPSSINDEISPSFDLPFENEVEPLQENLTLDELEGHIQNSNAAQAPIDASNQQSGNSPNEKNQKADPSYERPSLKDDYLRDLDDDVNQQSQTQNIDPLEESNHLYQAWKWILVFIFSLLSLSAIIGTVVYHSVTDKTETHVIKAIQGTTDIAMALVHAQFYHPKFHTQNWSDAEFLKTHLQTLLPDTSSFASQIDSQGQFNCCPYSLRIYTNSDLSRFVLISQSAPSLLHWLIPKPIIVVDSDLMEIRVLKDIKYLNRLLANPDPLEGINGKDLTTLINEGERISLNFVAEESNVREFSPPANLKNVCCGAENLIYNAPRYYRLGQSLIHKSIHLSSSKGTSHDVFALKQEIENIEKLNHFVLYSAQGRLNAEQARESIYLFNPTDKFLVGYLLLNESGKIDQAHLLDDRASDHFLNNTSLEEPMNRFELAQNEQGHDSSNLATLQGSAIDKNHPLYIQLQKLSLEREYALTPIFLTLMQTIRKEQQFPVPNNQQSLIEIVQNYCAINCKHKADIQESLKALYQQYEHMPTDQFLDYIYAFHLEHLIQNEIPFLAAQDLAGRQNSEQIFQEIQSSQTLKELSQAVDKGLLGLKDRYLKNTDASAEYKTALRNNILDKLEVFIISKNSLSASQEEDKQNIDYLLGLENIIGQEEKDYFLQEFNQSGPLS